MDEQQPPSEEKDAAAPGKRGMGMGVLGGWFGAVSPAMGADACAPPADGAAAAEEMGSAEGDPLKPPEGASVGLVPEGTESTDAQGPPQACR